MVQKQLLTITEQIELFMTDNPRTLIEHATFEKPMRKVTLTIFKQGIGETEKMRLLELAHKLANTQNK